MSYGHQISDSYQFSNVLLSQIWGQIRLRMWGQMFCMCHFPTFGSHSNCRMFFFSDVRPNMIVNVEPRFFMFCLLQIYSFLDFSNVSFLVDVSPSMTRDKGPNVQKSPLFRNCHSPVYRRSCFSKCGANYDYECEDAF